ncbi:DUF6932 family protein [Nevskia ramosa]|uniref:DUF6932 family protein n=1 Tax=Nevskia ramosa TaxID=64002 RepID=UPI002356A333|nr:hypothetical protein [Nevskia ramosa]
MIPAFDHNGVLPPHIGDPRVPQDMSPYPVTMLEVVQRFGTSAERRAILAGLLLMRRDMRAAGIEGFQWLDGSFCQDIEAQESRAPGDIDVVSYVRPPAGFAPTNPLPAWLKSDTAKPAYHVDHYLVNLNQRGEVIVESARYWSGLFSHTRLQVWKGMLRVELNATDDDQDALDELTELSKNDGGAGIPVVAAARPAATAQAGGAP